VAVEKAGGIEIAGAGGIHQKAEVERRDLQGGVTTQQQGTPLDVFEARRSQSFWRHIRTYQPVWDNMITEFNARVAAQ
jgi:hypothetical protein